MIGTRLPPEGGGSRHIPQLWETPVGGLHPTTRPRTLQGIREVSPPRPRFLDDAPPARAPFMARKRHKCRARGVTREPTRPHQSQTEAEARLAQLATIAHPSPQAAHSCGDPGVSQQPTANALMNAMKSLPSTVPSGASPSSPPPATSASGSTLASPMAKLLTKAMKSLPSTVPSG